MNEEFERILCQSLGEGRHSRGAAALFLGRNYKDIKRRQWIMRNGIYVKYMRELESTGFKGWENVEAKAKGSVLNLGNQTVSNGNYGNPAEGCGSWGGLATIQGCSKECGLYPVNDGESLMGRFSKNYSCTHPRERVSKREE